MWWSFQKVPIQSLRGDPMPFGGFYLLAISHAASSVSLVQYKLKKLICGVGFAPPEWHCPRPALDLKSACTSLPYLFAPAMLVWNYMGLTEKGGLSHEEHFFSFHR